MMAVVGKSKQMNMWCLNTTDMEERAVEGCKK